MRRERGAAVVGAVPSGVLWLAALARLWGLGSPSLWLDEAFSHVLARLPLDIAWPAMTVDAVHPPLYYLLLRPWLALAGESEFALRLPSVLAGVLTVALTLRVGRAWLGRLAATWAALLLAINPFHVWYSQEARMYAWLGLLALAVLWFFGRALQSQRRADWMALIVLSALAYLVHYFALFLPLVEFVFLLVTFRRHHQSLLRWTAVQAISVLPFAAWVIWLFSVAGGTFGIGWIPTPRLDDLLKTLWSFGMAYDGQANWLVIVVVLMWCALLLLGAWRSNGSGEARLLLALALALPLLITFLLSMRRPTYVDRFFIGSLPAFLLLASAGLTRLLRPVRWAVALILIGVSLWGIARLQTDALFVKEAWRDAAAYVQANERAGDVLAVRYLQYAVPFRYYYHGPLDVETVTVNQQTAPLEQLAAGHERLWLIVRSSHTDPHHLAWNKPFDLADSETDLQVRNWIEARTHDMVRTPNGVVVIRIDLKTK